MDITLHLNMKLAPFDRGQLEDFLEEALQNENLGTVTGGGTLTDKTGEVKNCDIEITLTDKKHFSTFVNLIHKIKLARGSKIIHGKKSIDIGELEGLAIYLNGTDLEKEVYQNCDVNYVITELTKLLDGVGHMYSYYEGDLETALYFYGISFKKMEEAIQSFTANYPLCEKCRIVQIA